MRRLACAALLSLIGIGFGRCAATASDARAWFDEAVRHDLSGDGAASEAFAFYRRAADAGLPEAEFNVAVMLDSGRGVEPDPAQAATWYARAAAHGNRRAAYNLGQLYEAGQGVPKNTDVARAWYAVAALPAAQDRLAALRHEASGSSVLTAPLPVAPSAGSETSAGAGGVELVWTSKPEPVSARFFVELRKVDPSGTRDVFSDFAPTSSLLVAIPEARGDYAWRVFAVSATTGQYEASDWLRFTVKPD